MTIANIREKIRIISYVKKREFVHLFISFMLGRVFLADAISPFATAYFCSYMAKGNRSNLKITLTVAFSLLGTLSTPYHDTTLKYLLGYVLLGLIYISVSTIMGKNSKFTLCTVCAVSSLISGMIYYAQLDNVLYNLSLQCIESAMCFALPFVIKTADEIFDTESKKSEIQKSDLIGKALLAILVVTGFCGLYIGNISINRTLCGLFIMVVAYSGGCTYATTCGVGLGILSSLYAFMLNEYAGIFGFLGLCAGIGSKFRRPGVILGFVVSSKLISMYFGGWSDSIFTDLEVIISVSIFCLVPYSYLAELKNLIGFAEQKNKDLKRTVDTINNKLKNISQSFESLATLTGRTFHSIQPNVADLSTVYDETAESVCKNCSMRFVCWDKEAFDTRDTLNKLTFILDKNGYVTNADVPELFRRKCIKLRTFVNELNKTYCRHKVKNQWQNKVMQSQSMICNQLNGVSDIMQNIADNIEDDLMFDKSQENRISCIMEECGMHCTDVFVVKTADGSMDVTLNVKNYKKNIPKICDDSVSVVSSILKRPMKIKTYDKKGRNITLRLTDKEVYRVESAYKSLPKNGERICGDTVLCAKLSGGKFAVILSDGMGYGVKAAKLSRATTALLKQFLDAGFDKFAAVKMICSAIMISNTESFATIDAAILDLYTAEVEILKAGANTTYIKSKNCIKKVTSDSLPVGIINEGDIDTIRYRANDGDLIVMISDGIQNATDHWVEEYLLNMHESDPEMIAKLLLDEAIKNKKQDDDMSVAVMKITKG